MTKILPSDKEAEQALLGMILTDKEVAEEFFAEAQLEWFYNLPVIAEAIFEVAFSEVDVDLLSVKAFLEKNNKLDKVGGMSGLADLMEFVTVTSSWKTHSLQIEKMYKQRELIKTARILSDKAYNEEFEQSAEKAMSDITNILSAGASKGVNIAETIVLIKELIEKNKGSKLIGWSWGNDFLDRFTGGIQRGKTYRIGSPSGVGKTNLVYGTIVALIEQGVKVTFVSLENTIEATYIKLLSAVQGINPNNLERGEAELDYSWIEKNSHLLTITDQLFDLGEIKREIIKGSPEVVILDYIGLVDIKGYDEKALYNRYSDEVKKFVQKHKTLAWIDLSNLNKDDDEERIRQHKGFNGSAKLRNNTDVGIHLFYYSPFYSYKKEMLEKELEKGGSGLKEAFYGKQAITFLISKNRLGADDVEEDFLIDFNKGIRYEKVSDETKKIWSF